MKSRWRLLLVCMGIAVLLTAYDWLTYQSGSRGFISWPAKAVILAVWPRDWSIAKDPTLFRWLRLLFWTSNIFVWTVALFGVAQLAAATRRLLADGNA